MTDKRAAIGRLFKYRMLPEWRRHRRQAKRYEEIVSGSKHPVNCVILKPSVQRNMLVHVYMLVHVHVHVLVHAHVCTCMV